jgi:hypothetical protein
MKNLKGSALCATVGSMMLAAMASGCGGEPMEEAGPSQDVSDVKPAITYGGHDYLFVTTPKTWEEAQTYCRLAGYDLVTINDANEELFLDNHESARGPYNWWIGLNDRGLEGTWLWSSGSSDHTNWYSGEPNDFDGNEDCAVDRFGHPTLGISTDSWDDAPCHEEHPFICERTGALVSSQGHFSYMAANTDSAQATNTATKMLYLYAGQLLTVGTCGLPNASANGNTYLRIRAPSTPAGEWFAVNDDAGAPCNGASDQRASNLSIIAPVQGTYAVYAGCYGDTACGGTVAYNIADPNEP